MTHYLSCSHCKSSDCIPVESLKGEVSNYPEECPICFHGLTNDDLAAAQFDIAQEYEINKQSRCQYARQRFYKIS